MTPLRRSGEWAVARFRALGGLPPARANAKNLGPALARWIFGPALIVGAAVVLRLAILGPLGPRVPYVTLFPAVMLAAVYGGLAGGLVATGLSAAIATFWFQGGRLDEGTALALVMFLATCTLMSAVGGVLIRVRERLRASEERFRIAARASNDVVYEWDLKDRIEWFGDVESLLGYGTGEFPRTLAAWIAGVHPEDLARVRAAIDAHLEGRARYDVEYRMVRKDGAVRWWSARGIAARSPEGTPNRWVGTITDVTEKKRAEEARRESEDRFEYFFENSVVGKSMTDPAGGLRVNRSFAAMLGYTQAELQGKAWEEISHPDDVPATKAEIEAILGGPRTSARFTKRYLRRDGAVVWADVSTTLRRDAEGNPLYFMTTILDVTEHKRAEDALRESESRFRQLAESMPQLVWTCEPDGPCDYLNRRWLDYTGVPAAPQLGFGWLEQIHPDDRAPTAAAWEAAVASGGDFQTEFRIRRHDGEYRWFDTRGVRLRDAEGRTVKWYGTNTDVSARKESEEEIRRLNAGLEERVVQRTAELEKANRELEAFSYSVSHDLRAPLRAVDGFSRILLEDHAGQLDAEGKRLLDVVRSSTRQMGQLIDDLLAFSRVGRQEMTRMPLDMTAIANLAFRGLVEGNGDVSFTVGALPRAEADPALIRQVFSNLISNSLKFTGPKARRVVEVAGRTEAERLVYDVKDNGVGFDMAYSSKLFGVFQRLHSSEEFEGTGVGLALVKRIVHRHGGEAWGEGKVGEGATFSFSLPRPGGPA